MGPSIRLLEVRGRVQTMLFDPTEVSEPQASTKEPIKRPPLSLEFSQRLLTIWFIISGTIISFCQKNHMVHHAQF